MVKKVLLSWSSGKDSAWALYQLRQNQEYQVVGLFCTVNEAFQRVAMHGVRQSLVDLQAHSLGLPIEYLSIPNPCSNEQYAQVMEKFIAQVKTKGIDAIAFGDLFLQDIRDYRERQLQGTGITPIFPLWNSDTHLLAEQMINAGLCAKITCIDLKKLPHQYAGRDYNQAFINDLPDSVDPCGERGEFHSFAYTGPMFTYPIAVETGEIVERDGFLFTDLINKKS